jgi:SAM-dependent methyltransferase
VSVRDAYSATGAAWRDGPERVYGRLADVLVAASPIALAGERVADVGAGTGATSRAIRRVGGRPIQLDLAEGMLRVDQGTRPPALVADARRLPLARGSCTAVVAGFCLNHVPDPEHALVEAARVVRPGGVVLISSYAEDDTHGAKAAVEAAVAEVGWRPEPWISEIRAESIPGLATTGRALAVATRAGLEARAEAIAVPFPDLTPADLVAWRVGMAQVAPFMASLPEGTQRRVEARALHLLGPHPAPLVRRIVILTAWVPRGG